MARVLITGGAGFIGSNLALELQGLGYEVVVVDNYLSGNQDNLKGFQGTVLTTDTTKPLSIDGPFEAVFHHGDITDPRFEPKDAIYPNNVASFQNVLQLATEKKAKLIYASTAGLYGNGPTPMKEDQPKELITAYGRSKMDMDRLAETLFEKMHIVGLRYFNVFGPREASKGRPASMVYHLYQQMKQGKRPRLFYDGNQKRDFIYVKDCVKANLCALSAKSGVYNVGTGIGSTFNELIQALNTAMNTQLEIQYFDMPYDPKSYQSDTQADTTKATSELGFTAQWPLDKAVADYLSWLEANDPE